MSAVIPIIPSTWSLLNSQHPLSFRCSHMYLLLTLDLAKHVRTSPSLPGMRLLQLAPWFIPLVTSSLCSRVTFSEGLLWLPRLNSKSFPVLHLPALSLPTLALFLSRSLALGVPHWPWGYLFFLFHPFLCPKRLSCKDYTNRSLLYSGIQLGLATRAQQGHWRERDRREKPGAYSLGNHPTGRGLERAAFPPSKATPPVGCPSPPSTAAALPSELWDTDPSSGGDSSPLPVAPEVFHHSLLVSLKPWLALHKWLFINLSSITYLECGRLVLCRTLSVFILIICFLSLECKMPEDRDFSSVFFSLLLFFTALCAVPSSQQTLR